MLEQLRYFNKDIDRILGKNKIRLIYIWMSRSFWGLFSYRIERGLYLLLGSPYRYLRILLVPFFYLLQSYSNIDIHYKAHIKGGILILHPSLVIVVSGLAIIGENLNLTGGNTIGATVGCQHGGIKIGDDCNLGANAVILGPLILGNNIKIGALTCVVKNFENDNVTLVGVPARVI